MLRGIKHFSFSSQHEFVLLINRKLQTLANCFLLNSAISREISCSAELSLPQNLNIIRTSRLSLSRTRLSRITAYLEVKILSLF